MNDDLTLRADNDTSTPTANTHRTPQRRQASPQIPQQYAGVLVDPCLREGRYAFHGCWGAKNHGRERQQVNAFLQQCSAAQSCAVYTAVWIERDLTTQVRHDMPNFADDSLGQKLP